MQAASLTHPELQAMAWNGIGTSSIIALLRSSENDVMPQVDRWLQLLARLSLLLSLASVASGQQDRGASDGYVGSVACAECHPSIYESYLKTDMGRSMSEITPTVLKTIPSAAQVAAPNLNRHFEVFARDGSLYQSEYAINPAGQDVFHDTRKLDFLIGSGANGIGGLVK